MASKKISLTGIKPTSGPHLGNYLGAIRPAIESSRDPAIEGFYFIADHHALNSVQNAVTFKKNVYEIAATWMALGLDLEKNHLYRQSDIPEILELTVMLSCFTSKGLMNRAHSYKASVDNNLQAKKDPDWGVNMGLFNYPILMSADILAFKAQVVPVGPDQVQHLEMARDIAQCFNSNYKKDIFVLPEAQIQEVGLIPGLDGRKMSSSYNNFILMFESEKRLKKVINKIATDSTAPEEPKDPENSVIFTLFKEFANEQQVQNFRTQFLQGISWGEAKAQLFEVVNAELKGPREKFEDLMANPSKVEEALERGRDQVRPQVKEYLREIKECAGFYQR
jgi:tryptophanyl-tRNA synthetase